MPKTPTDPHRHRLGGATMGTQWSVMIDGAYGPDIADLRAICQSAVDEVDRQMSTWTPDSDLMRFNAAPLDTWIPLPAALFEVLDAGLQISAATDGAFEMNVGDAVHAWGFGAAGLDLAAIRAASSQPRVPAVTALQLDPDHSAARKRAPLSLDLSGIAKGYGVDRLADALTAQGIDHALCSIDGEVRALSGQRDGTPWSVAIEAPDTQDRRALSVLGLADKAVATSGDYRHFVTVKGTRLAHTIDPRRGAPLLNAPASVTVLADRCMPADAMATALMVMGAAKGRQFAQTSGISALFVTRGPDGTSSLGTGLFSEA
ncbi:MAG: FAD:protein FMN transferase [Paracoccaceae bacterium]